jgi:putative ABC transport system permease protein
VAGYFGLIFGIILTELLAEAIGDGGGGMFMNPTIDLRIALTALTILIIAGAFAGLIPARKAIKIKPIDALRAE